MLWKVPNDTTNIPFSHHKNANRVQPQRFTHCTNSAMYPPPHTSLWHLQRKPKRGGGVLFLSLQFFHQSSPQSRGLTCQGLLIAAGNIIDLDLLLPLCLLQSVSALPPQHSSSVQPGHITRHCSTAWGLQHSVFIDCVLWSELLLSLQLQSTTHTHTHTCSLGKGKQHTLCSRSASL